MFNFPEEIGDWLAGQSYSQYNSLVKGSNKRKDLLEKKILFKKFLSLRPRVEKSRQRALLLWALPLDFKEHGKIHEVFAPQIH